MSDYLNEMAADAKLGVEEREESENDHNRLWRTECCKAAPCGASPFGDHRREREENHKIQGGNRVIGDIHLGDWGISDGTDHHGA